MAEEVIGTVRTAHAFGSQKTLSSLYDSHIGQAHKVELRSAIFHGCGLGTFFFVIYSSYALSQFYSYKTVCHNVYLFDFSILFWHYAH